MSRYTKQYKVSQVYLTIHGRDRVSQYTKQYKESQVYLTVQGVSVYKTVLGVSVYQPVQGVSIYQPVQNYTVHGVPFCQKIEYKVSQNKNMKQTVFQT